MVQLKTAPQPRKPVAKAVATDTRRLISFDTETTGVDLRHGAKPFFVTSCDEAGEMTFLEWDVDPLTREPIIPQDDLEFVRCMIETNNLVLQNAKFDATAIRAIIPDIKWPWDRTEDTLLAGHLLASNQPHNLTDMALQYLGVDIEPVEKVLAEACAEARRIVQQAKLRVKRLETTSKTAKKTKPKEGDEKQLEIDRQLAQWALAQEGRGDMPSCKTTAWRFDYWLPRALAKFLNYPSDHPWWTVLSTYANADSEVTILLWKAMKQEILRRKLWPIYCERKKAQPIAQDMEEYGVTISQERLEKLRTEYREESEKAGRICVNIAKGFGHDLVLPKSGVNNSLREFIFDKMELEPQRSKNKYNKGGPSLDAAAMQHYMENLPDNSKPKLFIKTLAGKRKRDTALQYMEGYERFWIPLNRETTDGDGTQEGTEGSQSRLLKAAGVQDLAGNAEEMLQREEQGLPGVGRKGDNSVPTVGGVVPPIPKRHGPSSFIKTQTGEEGQQRELRTDQLRVGDAEGAVKKHSPQPLLDVQRKDSNGGRVGRDHRHQVPDSAESSPLRVASRKAVDGWFVLHPSLNQTGTDTLRWSSSNPNEQNISKREGFNLRFMFGPAPGREWWSLDARGIEDRLPAYKSKQQELIDIFERDSEAPFYGSNHLLRFSIVYPDIWAAAVAEVGLDKAGPYCKKKYAATYYQWCKNGGFAVQYGAVEKSDGWGTADRAFHKQWAHRLLKERLSKLEAYNQYWIKFAEKYGYVETMPDKTVDPERGYPVMCSRTERGEIKPTVPLNYHIQSTAMWWTMKGMIRCDRQLKEWRENGFDAKIVMQVHDEMVFDLPKSRIHPKDDVGTRFRRSNLWRVKKLQDLMAEGGNDIDVPTPVGIEYNEHNWSEGLTF